ncbi:MAG TPA: LysE family translocator [Vicinamibacterales bacterium]|jgi:threonine/homoserine/homoserine lactone efflux protein
MFDARYLAYATISALLVISPGATMAVVMEATLGEGRRAALYTVLGINIGNSTLALGSALGMSFIFHQWPWTLQVVKVAGAGYLTYLGIRGVWQALVEGRDTHAIHEPTPDGAAASGGRMTLPEHVERPSDLFACITRGVLTNLLNPPVVLFYMTFLPQFIGPQDPFFARFLVLAATHVSMSLVWLTIYASALGVLADRFARPAVRRTLEGLTGVILVGFGVRLLLRP